jgi:hypothetical protein
VVEVMILPILHLRLKKEAVGVTVAGSRPLIQIRPTINQIFIS